MGWTDGVLALAPAGVAIGLALFTRRVEAALGLGVVVGAAVAARGDPSDAVARLFRYLLASVGWSHEGFRFDHLEITAFSLLVAATIGVMGASGGTRTLIGLVARRVRDRRGVMVGTWIGGMLVFFDDYANCLVVGNAMAPLADRFGVSRQKLAYLVDSTAAPIASLAVVSTWVGYEVDLIAGQLPAGGPSGFEVFLASLPYRFYSLFTLVFVGTIAFSGRDFGPMRTAEASARPVLDGGGTTDTGAASWAAAPIVVLLGSTVGWLLVDGWIHTEPSGSPFLLRFAALLGAANPYHAMLFGSALALVVAGLGAVRARRQSEALRAARTHLRQVAGALSVLFLAWALASAIDDTGASRVLATTLTGTMAPASWPAAVFLIAAGTAFATGTSFGTMGMLIPIALPVVLQLAPGDATILHATTAAVLAGACLGDHASPISDTTVLAAVGTGCSLVEHVRTQAPYALTAGALAVLCGYLPVGAGVSVWLCLAVGSAATVGAVLLLGRPPRSRTEADAIAH